MNQRYYALDVFRGATVALMILVNNPGSDAIYVPLEHAHWHGLTMTDLVFPFFIFAVGNAMAFVMPKLEAAGNAAFWNKVLKRTLLIFGIGVFLNWFPFVDYNESGQLVGVPPQDLRIFGVLQRIALSYCFASIIVHFFKLRGALIAAALLLLGYWALCILANPADPYSVEGWFGTAFDKAFMGERHMYHGEGFAFEPEGLMSTFAAIAEAIFGYAVGHYILTKGKTHEMLNGLFVAGCAMLFVGYWWDMAFPINKKIWTSSYAVYTSGLGTLVLAMLIYVIEFRNWRGAWTRFFNVFGKNPLFIYAMSGIVPGILFLFRWKSDSELGYSNPWFWFYDHLCAPIFSDPRNSSLFFAICFVSLMWALAWYMDKRKIYVRV